MTPDQTTDGPRCARTLAAIAVAGAALAAVAAILFALCDQRQSAHDLQHPPATSVSQPGGDFAFAATTIDIHTVQLPPSRR